VPEYALAIVGEVLVQTQPRKAPTQQARQRRLAGLERLAPEVLAVELEEVEGVEEDLGRPLPVPQQGKHGEPVLVAADHLAVDQARARLQGALDALSPGLRTFT
jgi:hypothetical protein